MTAKYLKAPFWAAGGKRRIARLVWGRFGEVDTYIEPFCLSAAVLLARPRPQGREIINDLNGMVCNFWRSVKWAPEAVAQWAEWPVSESDLHARHAWLVGQKESLQERLEGDPHFYDAKIAGWWCWGTAVWLGTGFCATGGPWHVVERDGVKRLERLSERSEAGIWRARPRLTQGIQRKKPKVDRRRGVVRRISEPQITLRDWMLALAERLRWVSVCCGDWTRVLTCDSITRGRGMTAVFLDPPYGVRDRRNCYGDCDDREVSAAVRRWAIEHGEDPQMRIALCGYEGEHEMPSGWECVAWRGWGLAGMGGQRDTRGKTNRCRERIWFSPSCLRGGGLLWE